MNKRKLIREAFVAKLAAAQLPVGGRIFENRARPFPQEKLPAINVWTGEEHAELLNESPKIYEKHLELFIEIYAMQKNDVDDGLDDIANLVESVFDAEDLFTLKDEVSDIVFDSSAIGFTSLGTQNTGVIRLKYTVSYISRSGLSASDLGDLETITTDWGIESPDPDQPETTDEITLPTT